MIAYYENKPPKGEYVLVIEGAAEEEASDEITLDMAVAMAQKLISDGVKASDAAREIAKKTKFSKSEIYSGLLKD